MFNKKRFKTNRRGSGYRFSKNSVRTHKANKKMGYRGGIRL